MKKSLYACLLVIVMIIGLTACGSKDEPAQSEVKTTETTGTAVQDQSDAGTTETAPAADNTVADNTAADSGKDNEAVQKTEITLRFFNGDTELGSIKAYKGEVVTGYEQFEVLDGYIFDGWYKTPTFLDASFRDLTKDTFTQDTKLFGVFRSAAVAEDTRSWYIVGEGSSPLLVASAWAGASVEESVRETVRLLPTGNAVNEFSITLDLFAGDKFQIIYDWQWDGQKGFGLFTDYDDSQLESGGGLGGEKEKANAGVLMDGNYMITITTDPENAKMDTVKVERLGDPAGEKAAAEEVQYTVNENTSVVMKGSWVSDWSENIELTRTEGTSIFTGTKELTAGTELYFMIWDNGSDTGIGMSASAVTDEASLALLTEGAYNVSVAADGIYTFTVDADTLTITVEKE